MSRNRSRIQVQKEEDQPTPPQIVKEEAKRDNPFGISFVVPTEIVKLPSGGNFYDTESPINGITEVEVKSMTAAEEDIMINDSFIQQGIVFDKLINSIMITPGIRSEDLMDCDKVAILMCARRSGYGDIVGFQTDCSACGFSHNMDVSLTSMLEQSVQQKEKDQDSDWHYSPESNTFSFNLPATDLEVSIKLLTPSDNKMLEESKTQKEKLNLPFNETIEFLRTCIVSAQGITDRTSINKLVEILPAVDARKIRLVHNENLPKMKFVEHSTCPNCGKQEEKEGPFSLGWFWSK